MDGSSNAVMLMPIVSKVYCSSSPATLTVRRRPRVTNGGGFVVLDAAQSSIVFTVDGCGVLGTRGELLLKDGGGESILYITKKGGIAQALRTRNRWNGYLVDCEGGRQFIFSLTDPKCPMSRAVRVQVEHKGHSKGWHFEVNGSFTDRACTIEDGRRNTIAQVGVKEATEGKDVYHVMVQPGHDQAFIVGVLAVLDNIHGESTRC